MAYGITRKEKDRSQVIRPISAPPYGCVLQVPYGPLTPTYIGSKAQLLEYFAPGGKPDPNYKDYWEALILLQEAPLLACRPKGDATYGGVWLRSSASGNNHEGFSVGITDPTDVTFPDNEVQFTVVGANPSTDNNNYSVVVSDPSLEINDAFDLSIYYNGALETTFTVSLLRREDGFGNSIYIEDVFEGRSDVQVVINSDADLTILPKTDGVEVSLASGANISDFADETDTVAAWSYFEQFNKYYTNNLVDFSCNAVIGKTVNAIAYANWYQIHWSGAPSIKATNPRAKEAFNTWKQSVLDYRDVQGSDLNLNSDKTTLWANWGKVSDIYNGGYVWVSPVSAAAARRSFTDNKISFSQASSGLNDNRGAIPYFVELEQDPSTVTVELEAKQINVVTYTPQGMALWNERTLQTEYSNTSFISHRQLFNRLEENIENTLLRYVFIDNNQDERDIYTSLIRDYLRPMVGNHVDSYIVKSDEENNPPELVNQRKMLLQVGVIPYPKANEITFEFIHSRSGVNLREVL
jgi:hypothetical protein